LRFIEAREHPKSDSVTSSEDPKKKGRKRNRDDPLRVGYGLHVLAWAAHCNLFAAVSPEAPSVAGEAASSSSSNAADATSPIVAGGQARARMTTRRRCHRRQSARGGRGVVVHVPSTSEFDCDVDLLSSVEASHISHNFSSSSSFLLILNPPVGSIDLRTC
jgi:hypothetical protein